MRWPASAARSKGLLPQRQVTHQDKRHAEELKAAADDLLSRLDQ